MQDLSDRLESPNGDLRVWRTVHLSVTRCILKSNKISVVKIVRQTNANMPTNLDNYGFCVFLPAASMLFACLCSVLHSCFPNPSNAWFLRSVSSATIDSFLYVVDCSLYPFHFFGFSGSSQNVKSFV